jgi:murein L,D-transpeptidase YcbB/YkuD
MKGFLAAVAITLVATTGSARAADATDWIRNTLESSRAAAESCTSEAAALDGTLSRIGKIRLPETGKVIVVNIPSGVVTAYENGVPVIESKAVVGKATTPTPELDTHVTYVRPNPTWTVPRSIIKRNKWLDKLAAQPEFFEDNNFKVISGGVEVSPYDAAANPEAVDSFIQKPGPGNALGAIKIGIENSQAIYLHDTNDPGKFDSEVRAASAGCVRIERVAEIAAWIINISPDQMQELVDGGSTQNLTPPEPVKVILGYWTAWPDASGTTRYYPDIYSKDRTCGRPAANQAEHQDIEQPETEERQAASPGPRFIPAGANEEKNVSPQPVWTESEAR